jgi:hypothetical protein
MDLERVIATWSNVLTAANSVAILMRVERICDALERK